MAEISCEKPTKQCLDSRSFYLCLGINNMCWFKYISRHKLLKCVSVSVWVILKNMIISVFKFFTGKSFLFSDAHDKNWLMGCLVNICCRCLNNLLNEKWCNYEEWKISDKVYPVYACLLKRDWNRPNGICGNEWGMDSKIEIENNRIETQFILKKREKITITFSVWWGFPEGAAATDDERKARRTFQIFNCI